MLFTAGITAPLVRDPKFTLSTIVASAFFILSMRFFLCKIFGGLQEPMMKYTYMTATSSD